MPRRRITPTEPDLLPLRSLPRVQGGLPDGVVSRSLFPCSNNLNQIAIHANAYGGIYPDEIKMLQNDYAELWGTFSDLINKLALIVETKDRSKL